MAPCFYEDCPNPTHRGEIKDDYSAKAFNPEARKVATYTCDEHEDLFRRLVKEVVKKNTVGYA